MPYQIEEVINWFLARSSMTPKKLQKILYYAYSWYLTLENENEEELENNLFDYKFEAWVHGPVIPRVYQIYREMGYNEIPKYHGELPQFDADTEEILEQVWEVYGGYTGNELESISHQESPWLNARDGYGPLDRCDVKISDRDIFQCYIQRVQ